MLTVIEFCQLTGKPEATIRYHIKRDEFFKTCFWKKELVTYKNKMGYTYEKYSYTCDEADVSRIIEYIDKHIPYERKNKEWTDIAIFCYKRGLKCKGCVYNRYCSKFSIPPLKQKVLEFVRLYGEPR